VVKLILKFFYCIVFLVVFLCVGFSMARADISVSLEIDRTDATPADTIKLVVTVKGANKAPSPTISGLDPFNISRGGTSSRIQVINSKIIREMDHIFYLTPQKPGTFVIGPAHVVIKGKEYRSRALGLKVKDLPTEPGDDRGPLFVTAALSTATGYVGQEFIYTLKFYRTKEVSDISLVPPEVSGLTFRRLGEHKEYIASFHGKNYSVIELRYTLNVDKPGSYPIPPAFFKMNVLERRNPSGRRRPFDDTFFGFSRAKPVSMGSNPVALTVKPLPEEGRPSDFSGLVGRFSLSMALLPQEVKRGESATLTLMVNGRGNVHLIPDLKLPDMENVKVYAGQPVLDIETGFDGTSGTKTMKWALVPQKEGSIMVPPMGISYFDPDSGRYVRSTTESMILKVMPGGDEPKGPALEEKVAIKKPVKKEVEMEGLDIFAIHEGPDVLNPDSIRQLGLWPLGLFLLLPPLGFILVLGFKEFSGKNKDVPRKGAISKFLKGIKLLKNDHHISDMAKITNAYLNERMGLSGGSITSNEVYELLLQKGIEKTRAEELRDILSKLEAHMYAGQGDTDRGAQLREDLVRIIKKIDRGISG